MKKRFTEEQIIKILKRWEAGERPKDLCRELSVHEQTLYNWKSKFGGLEISEAKRLKELEHENLRLKKLVADLSLDNQILKEVNSKKW